MKKMMKILSVILCVLMVISSMGVLSFAEDEAAENETVSSEVTAYAAEENQPADSSVIDIFNGNVKKTNEGDNTFFGEYFDYLSSVLTLSLAGIGVSAFADVFSPIVSLVEGDIAGGLSAGLVGILTGLISVFCILTSPVIALVMCVA